MDKNVLAVVAGIVLALVPASASPAVASPAVASQAFASKASGGDLLISADGVSYSSQFAGTLFGGGAVLVPQSSLSAEFSVRNATNRQARLRVTLVGAEVSNPELANSFVVAAAIASSPPRPITLDGTGGCTVVIDNVVLAPKESTQIVTKLTLGDLPGVVGQGERASMTFNLTLMDAAAAVPAATCTVAEQSGEGGLVVPLISGADDADSGVLPETNNSDADGSFGEGIRRVGIVSDNMLPLLMLAAFVGGGGLFWLRFRRNRRQDEGSGETVDSGEASEHSVHGHAP